MKNHPSPWRAQKNWFIAFLTGWAVLAGAGCAPSPKSGRGFRPPDGDALRGRQAFIDLKCYACHRVDGVELPAPTIAPENVVVLGGEVAQIRTYGRLVTSIIHPPPVGFSGKQALPSGQELTKPRMPTVNESMTVEQLLDIVAFLQPHYSELPPHFSDPGFPTF